jgi:hypothetical protein
MTGIRAEVVSTGSRNAPSSIKQAEQAALGMDASRPSCAVLIALKAVSACVSSLLPAALFQRAAFLVVVCVN